MRSWPLLLCALSLGCGTSSTTTSSAPANNQWSDVHLGPVLEVQDHRDSKALLTLLKDTSATVREAAAMAFASVQDSSARPNLIIALHDENATVRRAAARALSFIADTVAVKALAEQAVQETDPAMAEALYASSLRALVTAGIDPDPQELFAAFTKSTGYLRACIAERLRRLPKERQHHGHVVDGRLHLNARQHPEKFHAVVHR